MNFTYEFILKEEPKVKMKSFWGLKIEKKKLEGLKRKVDIFIGTKNIVNPKIFNHYFLSNHIFYRD